MVANHGPTKTVTELAGDQGIGPVGSAEDLACPPIPEEAALRERRGDVVHTTRDEIEPSIRRRIIELGTLLKERRAQRGLGLRAAAAEIGAPFVTLGRLENGQPCDLINMLAVIQWLGIAPSWFTGDAGADAADAYRRGWDDCAKAVVKAARREN